MNESFTVKINDPRDSQSLTIQLNPEVQPSECRIYFVSCENENILVVLTDLDTNRIQKQLEWDSGGDLIAVAVIQTAIITHFVNAGWKFVNSYVADHHDGFDGSYITFTFVR